MLSKNAVLIIDDSEVNRRLLSRILSEDYHVLQAENGQMGLGLLEAHSGEIAGVVLDLLMPVMDGYAFLERMSAVEAYQNIPVLVATADEGGEVENRCLKLGAWDFVRKPYNPNTVRLRLKNIISRSQLYLMEQMRYMAEHDRLTGLYNREKFFEASRQMLDRHPEETFAFVRFDIDRFRLVNSFFGEEEGNRLLRYVADTLKETSKSFDHLTYGRMEADVFCFCEPYDEEKILGLVEDARRRLRDYTQQYYVEPSFGIYVIDDPTLDVETMYARASMASEQCKDHYAKYYAYYDDSMSDAAFQNQRILNEMEGALQDRQFLVYLQPKYDLKTDLPCGAEALVRWKHPERGMIPPGEFIPVFEHNGFISKLDYYVWEEVCRLLRRWMDEGKDPAPISVNVSRVNMYNPNLVESLVELVERYGVPPALLNLELTESAYMDNPEAMKQTLERLHQAGFVVMMDDFGSGYSSLNTLRDISVDILKIDMKFLPTGATDGRSERILVSVIRMAGWLGIPVIMEGVETRTQRDFLQSVGCGYIQGYYYARPMPVEDYEALVAEGQSGNLPEPLDRQMLNVLDAVWSVDFQSELLFRFVRQPIMLCEAANGRAVPLRVNQALLDQFGDPAGVDDLEEMLRAVPETYRPALERAFLSAIRERRPADCDFSCRLPDGGWVQLRLDVQYVRETLGGHLLLLCLTDISRERALEEALRRLTAEKAGS